ncbi:MAG: response regulator transcription factor [Lachnospiraceae bacterium]|nr:response regulator transcription factor [Lachnospiraceae bacterium]
MVDILLVEDYEELNELIRLFLERDGYSVKSVFSGEEALAFLEADKAKLVILDVSLPQMDGFAVCAALREKSNVPVIFLSARVDKEDKINGFQQGADDYVDKPVDMDILCAKVTALMRRNYDLKQENAIIHSGAVTIDKEAKQVFLDKKEIAVTVKEYELLLLLVENPGKTLNKDYMFHQIWGVDSFSENQTLTVHIKMLRDKIEENPKEPKRIKTVWGVGYKYEEH